MNLREVMSVWEEYFGRIITIIGKNWNEKVDKTGEG